MVEKEAYTTKSGRASERFVLAKLDESAKSLIKDGGFLSYVDQGAGKVYAVKMAKKQALSPEVKAKREAEKEKKREARNKRILANIARRKAELEAKEAQYS